MIGISVTTFSAKAIIKFSGSTGGFFLGNKIRDAIQSYINFYAISTDLIQMYNDHQFHEINFYVIS